MQRFTTTIAFVSLFSPATALADSDGYLCIGRGYIAFETRFSQSPSRHLLHVVQFSPAQGIIRLPPIPLEDFQVHAMACRPTMIELEGWRVGYSVDISDPHHPAITSSPRTFDRSGSGVNLNLGAGARDTIIDLQGGTFPSQFQLVMARVSRPVEGGVERYTVTHLVRRDHEFGPGRIPESVKLFEGIFLETGD